METRVLGRSGIVASSIGIGTWAIGGLDWNLGLPMGWANTDEDEARRGIRRALALGANLFDTADVYGHGKSERLVGEALAAVPRSSVTIATKVGYFVGTAPHALHPLHMRHQLEMSLLNLRTSYVDIYFFHNLQFGLHDEYLDAAVEQMFRFKREGWIRAIGMRGPHRYALDRAGSGPPAEDKRQRFQSIADRINPDILGIRYNMLTPHGPGTFDPFQWAADRRVGILMYKPLAQGLLTGKYSAASPPIFPDGDHRTRKRWFKPQGLKVLDARLALLHRRFGADSTALIHTALQYCLGRSQQAVVVVGFRSAAQVEINLGRWTRTLTLADRIYIEQAFADIQGELGPYFRNDDD